MPKGRSRSQPARADPRKDTIVSPRTHDSWRELWTWIHADKGRASRFWFGISITMVGVALILALLITVLAVIVRST
jgi:hypothetical protein